MVFINAHLSLIDALASGPVPLKFVLSEGSVYVHSRGEFEAW